ncbi:RagB/SusD family nutrient uptake outer membrane protein [Pedobacter mucosus]|uniref:RagB/SusD family nutrient uptake outer membrane protein n=1 Tax=Pedobacter mucosus TaxID=2895286 RepID=UPI001EE3C6DF|nr:RagB/SusD family nutrient uptake outer membrane protein [Pedobacter mucosus]UKT65407.1 RagB/SusD family nutrient uptake outer membrane protein [Pedobacter mucosus]
MIKLLKNNIKKSLLIVALATVLPSCVNKDEFFLLPDTEGIDAAIWDNEGSVQLHLNRVYDVVVPWFPLQIRPDRFGVHIASDESWFPDGDANAKAALGLQGVLGSNDVRFTGNNYGGNPGQNKYWDIARCNDAITNVPKGKMAPDRQRILLGQYYALRAITYFELVKVYGGVPLPLEQQLESSVYTGGRKSAKECFAAIISDLNNSIGMLDGFNPDDGTGRGKITKLIATCIKAKVLFYMASPQFNPTSDPKHPYVQTKWNDALVVNKEAYDLCIAAGKRLMPNYLDIFRTEGTANTEAIFVRTYSSTINARGHSGEANNRPSSEGGSYNSFYTPTTKMLDAYPMRDGKPRGTSAAFPYDATLFWQNRDPRFEATFATNGSLYPLSGNTTRKQWTYNTAVNESNGNAVYVKRFTTPNLASGSVAYANSLGGSGMDWIDLRLAEVMLNYADCLNETGNIAGAKDLVRQIRVRAGVLQGDADYGLGLAGSTTELRTLILNERQIEFAFENKRNADLRRSRTMHLLSGSMAKLEIQLSATADKAILEAVTNGVMFRETLNINDKTTYNRYFRNVTVTNATYLPYNIPEFHYFYTFHSDFVNFGANIAPTIGWPGGTFDPLD